MNQSFKVGNIILLQDADECAIGIVSSDAEDTEIMARFKYPIDAISYFNRILQQVSSNPLQNKEETNE